MPEADGRAERVAFALPLPPGTRLGECVPLPLRVTEGDTLAESPPVPLALCVADAPPPVGAAEPLPGDAVTEKRVAPPLREGVAHTEALREGDAEDEGEPDARGEPLPVPDRDGDGDAEGEPLRPPLPLGEPLLLGESDGEGDSDGEWVPEGEPLCFVDAEPEGVGVCDGEGVAARGERLPLPLPPFWQRVGVALDDTEGGDVGEKRVAPLLAEPLRDAEEHCEDERLREGDADSEGDAVPFAEALGDDDAPGEPDGEPDAEAQLLCVPDAEAQLLCVPLPELVPVAEPLPEPLRGAVPLPVPLPLRVPVPLPLDVALRDSCVRVGVELPVPEPLRRAVPLPVPLPLCVPVPLPLDVALRDSRVFVGVELPVPDDVLLRVALDDVLLEGVPVDVPVSCKRRWRSGGSRVKGAAPTDAARTGKAAASGAAATRQANAKKISAGKWRIIGCETGRASLPVHVSSKGFNKFNLEEFKVEVAPHRDPSSCVRGQRGSPRPHGERRDRFLYLGPGGRAFHHFPDAAPARLRPPLPFKPWCRPFFSPHA